MLLTRCLDGNRINQGIAEKLYTGVMGLSLFFSSFIVAIAVQWKLALITMTIVPAMVVIIGGCIAIDAPIEARVVSIERVWQGRLTTDLGLSRFACTLKLQLLHKTHSPH